MIVTFQQTKTPWKELSNISPPTVRINVYVSTYHAYCTESYEYNVIYKNIDNYV